MLHRKTTPITLCLALLLLLVLLPTRSREQDTSDESPTYLIADIYGQSRDDSLFMQPSLGVTVGTPLYPGSRWVYEWQRPFLTGVNFKARPGKDRLTATTPVMFAVLLAAGGTGLAIGADSSSAFDIIKFALAPFGSHIGYQATSWLTAYAGVIPEFVLFTDNDGILFQTRLGLRLVGGDRIAINGGFEQTHSWGFDQPSATFPVGIFLGLSFVDPEHPW